MNIVETVADIAGRIAITKIVRACAASRQKPVDATGRVELNISFGTAYHNTGGWAVAVLVDGDVTALPPEVALVVAELWPRLPWHLIGLDEKACQIAVNSLRSAAADVERFTAEGIAPDAVNAGEPNVYTLLDGVGKSDRPGGAALH